jgi:hypothetical protein
MPNHVSHNCVITGPAPEVDRFVKKMLQWGSNERTGEKYQRFDFDQIIPMPELLKDSKASSLVSDGLAVLGYDCNFGLRKPKFVGKEQSLERFLNWSWVKSAGITTIKEVEKALIERNPGIIDEAKRALKIFEEYGHIDWYSWSIQNWGTKWNSYSFKMIKQSKTMVEFNFDTAWSFPEPVFDALAKEFPELVIDVAAFDEGHCFCMHAHYNVVSNVRYNEGKCDPAGDRFSAEIYERVYGEVYEPCENEDECD